MHVVVEILLHGSICGFYAQNVLVASFNSFQSTLQILDMFLDKHNIGNSKLLKY